MIPRAAAAAAGTADFWERLYHHASSPIALSAAPYQDKSAGV